MNKHLTDSQLERIIESANEVLSALAGTNEDAHPDNSTKMCRLWDDLNDTHAPPEVVKEMAIELQQYRNSAFAIAEILDMPDMFNPREMPKPGREDMVFMTGKAEGWNTLRKIICIAQPIPEGQKE